MTLLESFGDIGLAILSDVIPEDFKDRHPNFVEIVESTESIKKWFGQDKESKIADVARGSEKAMPIDPGLSIQSEGMHELHHALRIAPEIMQMYKDVEEMDDYPEISAALDLYAEDSTIPNSFTGKTIWIESKEIILKRILEDLLHRRLRIEEDIYGLARTLSKYGNAFAEIVATDEGVVGLNYLDPPTVRRIEDKKGALIGYVQDPYCSFKIPVEKLQKALANPEGSQNVGSCVVFSPWEVVHWRLRGKRMRSSYGQSVLDSARWIWKRLMMLEDSALVYKLTRSPGRYAFYIDVGDLPPKEAKAHLNNVKRMYQKKKLINPTTGQLDFRHNPLSPHEDFFVPTRGGQESTRIEVISGPDSQMMDDVDYFRSKLVAALKVPKRYLGLEEDTLGRAASQDDVRFGRAAMRVQREVRNGLRHVERVHLAALNIDPDRLKWETMMTIPSYIYELAQIEIMNAQADLARNLEEYFPKPWIIENVFKMTADEADNLTKEKNAETDAEALRGAQNDAEIDKQFPEPEEEPQEEPQEVESVRDRRSMILVARKLDKLAKSHDDSIALAAKTIRRLEEMAPKIKEMHRTQRNAPMKQRTVPRLTAGARNGRS